MQNDSSQYSSDTAGRQGTKWRLQLPNLVFQFEQHCRNLCHMTMTVSLLRENRYMKYVVSTKDRLLPHDAQ